ncbi:MAG: SDR family oxidoreductase [Bacteroidetes bacterium]|nr:SDR family oxidoreductase [Bacteroidota bacterium]
MKRSLNQKTVLITGASSGIGAACAQAFAQRGCRVVLASRNLDALLALQASLPTGQSHCVQADVSVEADCRRMVVEAVERFGSLDVLVNNAGISMRALFRDTAPSVLRQLMDTNFWGAVYTTHYALPHLLKNRGSVVGVSSIAGYRGLPGRTGYSASKFAMQGFLESLRSEHLHDGLQVLVICPGFTASNIRNNALNAAGSTQGESPRNEGAMMTAAEVAEHLVKGVENNSRTIVLTTQGKLTVFLNKWFPAFMDKMVYNHLAKEPDSPFAKGNQDKKQHGS